jgi:hypothetical protein
MFLSIAVSAIVIALVTADVVVLGAAGRASRAETRRELAELKSRLNEI